MNENVWLVSQTIRYYLVENPNNDAVLQRAESYGYVHTCCMFLGIDTMSLTVSETEIALKISRLTDSFDTIKVAVKIFEYNRDNNTSALELLKNAAERNCTRICLAEIFRIPVNHILNDHELYAAVAIANLMDAYFN